MRAPAPASCFIASPSPGLASPRRRRPGGHPDGSVSGSILPMGPRLGPARRHRSFTVSTVQGSRSAQIITITRKEAHMNERRYREFRWLERGTGEPVVLLHGLMSRPDHWECVLEGLSDVCRPIAPSLPIFDSALREPSIRELALFVRDFLDAIEIPRAVVGGNSLGGHVTLALALAHPERVSGLVLTGSSGLLERSSTGRVPHRPSPAYVR